MPEAQPVLQESRLLMSVIPPLLFGGGMLVVILINHAFFTEAVTYFRDRFIEPRVAKKHYMSARPALYLCFLLMITSHLVEIAIWAYSLQLAGLVPDFEQALFFSGSTYTTLGYGTDIMPTNWNTVTAVIAISGMFSIAWTTSFLMSLVSLFHNRTLPAQQKDKS